MKHIEFPLIGLVKSNNERPFLGTNPSFLRFRKNMRMDLSNDKIQRVFVTLFGLVKTEKRHSLVMMGKLREGNYFILQINGSH